MTFRSFSEQQLRFSKRIYIIVALSALGFGLSGCLTRPADQSGKLMVETPDSWYAAAKAQESFRPNAWMKDFGDPRLEKIVTEALEHNYDLQAAGARLDAAMASALSDKSGLWPSLSLSGSGSKSRRNSSSGISQTPTSQTYGLNARLGWEIDLWGKVRNGYRGAIADEEAAVADYYAFRLSIGARTAKAWYAAIEATQQFELEQRILKALEEASRIVEENFANGIAGALDVRLVRANMATSRSTLEQRRRSRNANVRALELLLGRYPANELAIVTELPKIAENLPVGMPSELLLRRPDVVGAERRLAAAEQRKFESSKARLPSVNLNLTRGTSATEVSDIFKLLENRIWSQSLSISQTLFQGKRLKANYERSRANYEQTLANYTQTVLTAFREVEDALSDQTSYALHHELLTVAVNESVAAELLAWDEYASGLTGITTVLDSVRRSIAAQRSLIRVTNQRIQSRIDLYLALGGGFDVPASVDS